MAEPGPLDRTLERIGAAGAHGIRLVATRHAEPDRGWLAATELVRADGPLDTMVAAAARQAGTPLATVGAEWLLERYAWQLGALVAAALVADARVPDIAPDRVLVGCWEGLAWGVALPGERIHGRDDDPDAADPRLVPVGDEAALSALAGRALAQHMEPLVEALATRRLRPRRALWRATGDRIAQGFIWAGEAFDRARRARALARAVISDAAPFAVPLRSSVDERGVRHHLRASCCLNHRVPGRELCPGCPRVHLRR